jgi:hypothetical protein
VGELDLLCAVIATFIDVVRGACDCHGVASATPVSAVSTGRPQSVSFTEPKAVWMNLAV